MHGKAKMNEQGRVVIPAACREEAGIAPGTELLIEVVGEGELRLRTREQAIRVAQEIFARHSRKGADPVAELIAERRREAKRER
ncbi:MAG TPA: AbrB/MazE/SpoVT family DNA-binding domain-containing protein [Stellaceae bacterium]|nr:AbrB/MazE/SpoVT family DNA-binding domain-containing protein [Stellaceae bacterium]